MKINTTTLFFVCICCLLLSCGESKEDIKQRSREILTNTILGLGHLDENNLEAAEIDFLQLIELAPDESMGFANLGLVYLRMGKLGLAEEQLQKAINIDGDQPAIRLILAKIYEMSQQKEEVINELLYILKIDPENAKALHELASQYDSVGDPRRAEYLKTLSSLKPGNIVPQLRLIRFFLQTNNSDEALKILEEMPQKFSEFPKESDQYYQSSIDFLRTGNTTEASLTFRIFYNYIKTSGDFQRGISALEGTGENLTGYPIISYDPMALSNQKDEAPSLLEIIRFTDVTASTGLSTKDNFATLVVSDFDNDGDNDIYLGGTKTTGGPRLYRNNFGTYEDITDFSGLSHSVDEKASVLGDIDNDGFLDLFIVSSDANILYKNLGDGSFTNISEAANLQNSGDGNKAIFFDMDHEGDLDLLIVGQSQNRIYRNNGDGSFQDFTSSSGIVQASEFNGTDICFGDFNRDATTDFAITYSNGKNSIYQNLRQGRFEEMNINSGMPIGENGQSIDAGDYNNDGYLDLLITHQSGDLVLYQNKRNGQFDRDPAFDQTMKQSNSKSRSAQFFDFDNDGYLDIIFTSSLPNVDYGTVQLYHNTNGNGFEDVSNLLPVGILAREIQPVDLDDDGDIDLAILSEDGVRLLRNEGGNINHYLKIKLVGLRQGSGKNNHFGVGAKIEVRTGDLYQMKEVNEPVTYFGLGAYPTAEVVRIQWTNGVPQNIYFPEGEATLLEQQVLKGSCPFLYTWDGDKYVFVKDIMWRSALGMPLGIMGEAGSYAFPNAAQEYIKVSGELLQPRNGAYSLQVTSELWEAIYFDKLELVAVDHPSNFDIFVDEKFTPPPYPKHNIFKVKNPVIPLRVSNDSGEILTPLISEKDDQYISDFNLSQYQGVTELTNLEIYLGDNIDTTNLQLFMNGWIFPSDASINTAISQSGNVQIIPPQLQVMDARGNWQTVKTDIGFPMGKNKTIVIDLSDIFLTDNYRLRLQTNLQIYWDHIFFANVEPNLPVRITSRSPSAANLHFRGYSAMKRKGGRYGPHWFDYSDVTTGQKWHDLTGRYTRYGDVMHLLTTADDRYVISNGGDEMTIQFELSDFPELPEGWKRDFLIYSEGWVKDGDLNTAAGNTVEPLPFHGMTKYPYDESKENYPNDSLNKAYQNEYNTRFISPESFNRRVLENN